jgi:succinate dehydrogenase/fumarate reductase flavoprotein subunit
MMQDAPGSKKSSSPLPGALAPKTWNDADKHPEKAKSNHANAEALEKLREIMWKQAGILRSGKELRSAIEALAAIDLPLLERDSRAPHELRNLRTLALLVARCGLAREESRGSHYRSDFPYRDDDNFQKHSLVSKGQEVVFQRLGGRAVGSS